jgi:hypothetical protein
MVMAAAKARYKNTHKDHKEFKLEHWWNIVRHQPKWLGRDDASKRARLGESGEYSSGGGNTEEEVTRPIGRDRAKAAARRGRAQGKAPASSASSGDSTGTASQLSQMSFTSDKLALAILWKQYNIMRKEPTENMTPAQRRQHKNDLKLIRLQLHGGATPAEEEEEEDEEEGAQEEEDEEEEEE